MCNRELCCPLLLTFIRRLLNELYLLAILRFLHHADGTVNFMEDILGKLRICLHLLNDSRK